MFVKAAGCLTKKRPKRTDAPVRFVRFSSLVSDVWMKRFAMKAMHVVHVGMAQAPGPAMPSGGALDGKTLPRIISAGIDMLSKVYTQDRRLSASAV